MEDIEKASKLIDQSAGEIGMFEVDRKKASDLLQDYGRKRAALLDAMALLLARTEVDSLSGDWRECCTNGSEGLGSLNDAVPAGRCPGLAGVGLTPFYQGELKIWAENAKGAAALAAQEIETIRLIDAALIEECNAELQTIKDGDEVIQDALKDAFPRITGNMREAISNIGQLVTTARTSGKFTWAEDFTNRAGKWLVDDFQQILEQAGRRGALKRRLLEYIQKIEQTKTAMGEWKITQTLDEATTALEALPQAADGYEAIDWKEFTDKCKEALEKRRDQALEKSDDLFGELYSALKERTDTDFKTLYRDSNQYEAWNNEIGQLFEDIESALEAQQTVAESLAEGPFTQALKQILSNLRDMIKSTADEFGKEKEEVDKEMG